MKEILESMYKRIQMLGSTYCLAENVKAFVKYCKSRKLTINGGLIDETGQYFYL